MKKITVLISLIILNACQKQDDNVCWEPATKTQAEKIAVELFQNSFVADAKATWPEGKEFTDKDEKTIREVVKLTLTDFHQIALNKESGSYQCGANAKALVQSADKKLESDQLVIKFNVNKGENGNMVSMTMADGLLAVEQSLANSINKN